MVVGLKLVNDLSRIISGSPRIDPTGKFPNVGGLGDDAKVLGGDARELLEKLAAPEQNLAPGRLWDFFHTLKEVAFASDKRESELIEQQRRDKFLNGNNFTEILLAALKKGRVTFDKDRTLRRFAFYGVNDDISRIRIDLKNIDLGFKLGSAVDEISFVVHLCTKLDKPNEVPESVSNSSPISDNTETIQFTKGAYIHGVTLALTDDGRSKAKKTFPASLYDREARDTISFSDFARTEELVDEIIKIRKTEPLPSFLKTI